MIERSDVIIIGGGFGGISVARELAKSSCRVTIIDKNNHHLFQPLLYQVATAALSPGDIAIPIRAMFSKDENISVIMDQVMAVNKEGRSVRLRSGREISYDYLIMAPGAVYNYFGNDHWKSYAPGLKSISDSLSVRETIILSLETAEHLEHPVDREPWLTFAVIGGGPTGVEMAGAIAEIAKRSMMRDYRNLIRDDTRVYLIEAGPRILNGYPESLSRKAQKELEGMGVKVLLNSPVNDITENGVTIDNQTIRTPNIIWAAGVIASPLVNKLGVEQDRTGRVMVEDDMSLKGFPNLFVIGDAAHATNEKGEPLPAVAPVAIQQGKYVGSLIRKRQSREERKPFRYKDKGTMATIGRAKAVAEIRGWHFTGFIAWALWSVVHIFFLIGFRNRFRVFAEWIWYYFTFKRGVRLITRKKPRHRYQDAGFIDTTEDDEDDPDDLDASSGHDSSGHDSSDPASTGHDEPSTGNAERAERAEPEPEHQHDSDSE